MLSTIAPKTEQLIDAAITRWPDVYNEAFKTKILPQLKEYGGDERQQLYAVREHLLDRGMWAAGTCEGCELKGNRMCRSVWADGTPSARIFIIGEGPSQFDQRTGVPFTHPSELALSYCYKHCKSYDTCFPAQCLEKSLPLPPVPKHEQVHERVPATEAARRAGAGIPQIPSAPGFLNAAIAGMEFRESWNKGRTLDRGKVISDLYMTNIVKCRRIDKDGNNYSPGPPQARACSKWLEIQLAIVQPQVVLLLGSLATTFMLDMAPANFKMSDFHSKFGPRHPGTKPKLPASVTHIGTSFHPSYIARRSAEEQQEAFAGMRSIFELAHKVVNTTQ